MPDSEETRAWLDKGRSDLKSARVLLNNAPPITDTATFHCQQAAEKHLKAFLVAHGVPFDRVHNLVYLLDACVEVDARLSCLAGQAALLTPYAVMSRYPGSMPEPVPEHAEAAYAAALQVVEAVNRRLET